MRAVLVAVTLLACARPLEAECVREGRHKVREIMGGVVGAAASSFITRSVSSRPHTYSDYRVEDGVGFSPEYNRRMMISYAAGSALGILIATPRGCHSWWRPLPGTMVPMIPFWSASEKPMGMIFTSMFLPPFQAGGRASASRRTAALHRSLEAGNCPAGARCHHDAAAANA